MKKIPNIYIEENSFEKRQTNAVKVIERYPNKIPVVVSHDIGIFPFVDYVAFLYKGKIEYFGEAKTIWQSSDPYVYQFIRGLTKGPLS